MKDAILKIITLLAGLTWIVTVCMFDSTRHFPTILIVNLISGIWIVLHVLANKEYYVL